MPRQPTSSRRKPATATRVFMFSDLRDYTSFVEAKGDAAAARLLREYRTLVRREVGRHDGAEVKTEGDSFYVVFHGASTALECAVAILRAADARNAKDPSAPLRIGVGLHVGETIEYDDQFVGSAVNIASRLAGKAGAMELLISDTMRGLVRTSQVVPMADRGPLELKGVAELVRAWSVEWRDRRRATQMAPTVAQPSLSSPAPAVASGQLLCPIVVGRTAEAARFDAALARAIGGAGQTLVLGGEAGVGKTTFVREAQVRAAAQGARALLGATHQSDATLPYAPFVSAIRSGFRGLARDELGRVLQRSAPELAELFPELARSERAGPPTTIERHRLSVAFQHLFRSFAREAPLLVVLEDLHWADETSLELLRHLARELRDARVAILATYRTDEMHRRHPFLRALADLQRERLVTEIQLARLTRDETRELIRATMATRDPNVSVSVEFRDALYERAEGNPFFTEELLKALVESGGVFLGEHGWDRKPIAELTIPGTVREAVRSRVERLGDDARQTLSAASIIGQRFPFELLRDVRGVDDTTLESHLRELIEEQLVAVGGRDVEEYAFRHALTREVVEDDLLVRERKRLHRTVADSLERDGRTEPALLAHHLLAAGERERAAPVLVRAGDRALRAGAPREAAAHYASAIDIGLPDRELAPIMERQTEAYHVFDQPLAITAARETARLYEQLDDARGRSRMLRLEGRAQWYEGRVEEGERLTQEAIHVLGGEECPELARAVTQSATFVMTAFDMDRAWPLADKAVALAERVRDPWALSNALVTRGSTEHSARGLADIRRGIEIGVREGIAEAASRGYSNAQITLIEMAAPWEERRALLDEGLEFDRAHGFERGGALFLQQHRMFLEYGLGDWDRALATGRVIERGYLLIFALNVESNVVSAREGPHAALPVIARIAELRENAGTDVLMRHILVAGGLARAGRIDDARLELRRLLEVLRDMPSGAGRDSTRSTILAGPGSTPLLSAAVMTDEAGWTDLIEAELADERPLRANVRHLIAAARAVFANDAPATARSLLAGRTTLERVGFGALWHDVATAFRQRLLARRATLGADWETIDSELRAFAEKVRAQARLAELA